MLYGGSYRDEEILVHVRLLECGAGEIDCLEFSLSNCGTLRLVASVAVPFW